MEPVYTLGVDVGSTASKTVLLEGGARIAGRSLVPLGAGTSGPVRAVEEVLSAAHAAQCDDILEKLPQGLDTVVGAKGVYLSGGEQQRIALARAILKDAPIVVLDEATAFADPENEHQIQKAFETLTRNKTVLMIAHRLSTVQNADNIIVLSEGKIAEQGSHSALLEKNGVYAAMWADYQRSAQWKVGKEAAVW